jgi:hypothetical protein
VGLRWRSRAASAGRYDLTGSLIIGTALLVLPLVWPRLFSPLIWGAGLLLVEPLLYRKLKEFSLFADVYRGDWGRIGRILVGGLAIGGLWEGLNYWARGKWIYTVPFLEEIKLFEMPPFGFVGFPIFALSAWSLYHALCALGVAHTISQPGKLRRGGTAVAAAAAVVFATVVLLGMERRTISSTTPRMADLPANPIHIETLSQSGIRSPFDLANREPARLTQQVDLPPDTVAALVEIARLVTLRGIGTAHAGRLQYLGIATVCDLATRPTNEVWADLHGIFRGLGARPTLAEVRVWSRASIRACGTQT